MTKKSQSRLGRDAAKQRRIQEQKLKIELSRTVTPVAAAPAPVQQFTNQRGLSPAMQEYLKLYPAPPREIPLQQQVFPIVGLDGKGGEDVVSESPVEVVEGEEAATLRRMLQARTPIPATQIESVTLPGRDEVKITTLEHRGPVPEAQPIGTAPPGEVQVMDFKTNVDKLVDVD